ncbi:MAG: hypothetical protein N2442_09030 [Spirochaetes bacterium]|nr:hypothetical protein [Spirochaetota bacterium]
MRYVPFAVLMILLVLPFRLMGDDYRAQYLNLLNNQQYEELLTLLGQWEKMEPTNPELYIAYFNYHFNRGRRLIQTMGQSPDGRHLVYTKREYDPEHAKAALRYIDTGLSLAPNRLDIHFGKVRLLAELGDLKGQKEAIVTVLRLSIQNGNRWMWTSGIPLTEGEASMFAGIEEYLGEWFDRFAETGSYLKEVAELETSLYPKNPWGWNILAGYYREVGDLPQVLSSLLKAEALDPTDGVVIANIGQCYVMLRENEKALEYFKKLQTHPAPQLRQYASEWIQNLKSK